MQIADFDYNLPEEKIAKYPPKVRGEAKLLVLERNTGAISHRNYRDLVDYLGSGDVLVLNNTKVIKARLIAETEEGKPVELLLLEKHGQDNPNSHKAIYRGKLQPGQILSVAGEAIIVEQVLEGGIAIVASNSDFDALCERAGKVPIPPYLKRDSEIIDQTRYQTIFAEAPGSVAAPTASLNFTDELAAALTAKGVTICYLTLHVGSGTFLPIRVDKLEEHKMHSEYYEIPAATAEAIMTAKAAGRKVMAIGTTVTRALEHAAAQLLAQQQTGNYLDIQAEAEIFIYPGYEFQIVDQLLTNFHAPRTTVLMLAAAFADKEHLLNAYHEALKKDYQFLSYGDSMLLV